VVGYRSLKFALACILAITFASACVAAPPEPITLKEHKGWVSGVVFSPDGKTLVTASADGTVKFWDVKTGTLQATVESHTDIVAAVAYSKDGKHFASASFDGTVKVWTAKQEQEQTFRGHRGAVLTVAFNPNGRALAAGGIDGTVRVWELDGKNEEGGRIQRWHASWVNAIAFRPDGEGLLASVSSDNEIRFNPSIGKRIVLRPKLAEVRSVAWSPDSKLLATGTRYGITKVWDNSGDEVASLKNKHGGDVWAVGFSHDGKLLATVDGDWNKPSEVVLYDTKTWKEAARLKHTNEVLCLAWHPKKLILAAGAWDKTTKVWDVSELVKDK
jgi:WD40 repeat protein